jgi:hypothetical protein
MFNNEGSKDLFHEGFDPLENV